MKRAASLSGTLLARKGAAQPSMGHRSPAHALPGEPDLAVPSSVTQFPAPTYVAPLMHEEEETDLPRPAGAVLQTKPDRPAPAPNGHKPAMSYVTATGGIPGKSPVGNAQRIAMTVRLDHADHLQLKILSAHSRLSAQEIFSRALQEFIDQHGMELGLPEGQG